MSKTQKPIIFISHIHEEKVIAQALKRLIEQKFLGAAKVFVSSDDDSLGLGDEWLDSIKTSIKQSTVFISICSSLSVRGQKFLINGDVSVWAGRQIAGNIEC